VVFVQTGSIPRKVSGEIFINPSLYASFPVYPAIRRPNVELEVRSNGIRQSADVLSLQLVDIARNALVARGKQITTKQVLRIAAKKNLAQEISGENEVLGALFSIAFLASEVADTRSWETLPAHVTLVQIPLSAGTHNVRVKIQDGSRIHDVLLPNVDINAGRASYRSVRVGRGTPRSNSKKSVAAAVKTPVSP